MKRFMTFIICLFPTFLLANGDVGGERDFDIVWRTINFLIFFGLLFYLLKGPLKKAHESRINSIAARLENIENELNKSKANKEKSKQDLQNAKDNAVSLVETAKKEAVLLEEKIKQNLDLEIKQLEKSFDEQKEFETRKATRAVVSDILDEVLDSKNTSLNSDDLVKLVYKKAV